MLKQTLIKTLTTSSYPWKCSILYNILLQWRKFYNSCMTDVFSFLFLFKIYHQICCLKLQNGNLKYQDTKWRFLSCLKFLPFKNLHGCKLFLIPCKQFDANIFQALKFSITNYNFLVFINLNNSEFCKTRMKAGRTRSSNIPKDV